jgi:hypothetical protein
MKLGTIWNGLRVLAIAGLGFVLFFVNVFQTLPSRRVLFDLTRNHGEQATERTREKLELIRDKAMGVMEVNLYAIPLLVIVALSPRMRTERNLSQQPRDRVT